MAVFCGLDSMMCQLVIGRKFFPLYNHVQLNPKKKREKKKRRRAKRKNNVPTEFEIEFNTLSSLNQTRRYHAKKERKKQLVHKMGGSSVI